MRSTTARRLLAHDRPFSAMNLLFRSDEDTFPTELGIEVLRKPVTGTDERIEVLRNPSYVLRGMLNQLGAAEAPTEALAVLELSLIHI